MSLWEGPVLPVAMEDVPALRSIADASRAIGQAAFFGLFLLSFETPVRGLIQRVLETAFYGWMLLLATVLLVNA